MSHLNKYAVTTTYGVLFCIISIVAFNHLLFQQLPKASIEPNKRQELHEPEKGNQMNDTFIQEQLPKADLKVFVAKQPSGSEPLVAEIVLSNPTSVPLLLLPEPTLRQIDLRLSKNGVLCEKSEAGKELLRSSKLAVHFGPKVRIPPNQQKSWEVNLAECFELHDGSYRLTASVTVASSQLKAQNQIGVEPDLELQSFEVTSKEVTLDIR